MMKLEEEFESGMDEQGPLVGVEGVEDVVEAALGVEKLDNREEGDGGNASESRRCCSMSRILRVASKPFMIGIEISDCV